MATSFFSAIGEKMEFDPRFRTFLNSQKGLNFSRKLIVSLFMQNILRCFKPHSRISVALVGGSKHDPELSSLRELGFEFDVTTFGIEDSDEFLDLNFSCQITRQFDLVICSQVLEHVWNCGLAIETLCKMVKPAGKLWISVPASNRKHASPDYFSAGYTPRFLIMNCVNHGFETLYSLDFVSKREYAARHLLPSWLTEKGHKFPLIFAFEGKSLLRQIVLTFMYLRTLLYLQLSSSRLFSNSKYSTETVFLASKSI